MKIKEQLDNIHLNILDILKVVQDNEMKLEAIESRLADMEARDRTNDHPLIKLLEEKDEELKEKTIPWEQLPHPTPPPYPYPQPYGDPVIPSIGTLDTGTVDTGTTGDPPGGWHPSVCQCGESHWED